MKDTSILGVKVWRQKKGIGLDAIAASTKLSVRILEAIEAGDFTRLPGGIYNTNYIRQYASAIGFDEGKLVAYYQQTANPSAMKAQPDHQPSRMSRLLFQH